MTHVIASVDAHVHLHPCYDPDELFENAHANLCAPGSVLERSRPLVCFLLFAECAGDDCFGALRALADGQSAGCSLSLRHWSVLPTAEDFTVVTRSGARALYVLAGRQIACREGLEVLVLGSRKRFPDGRPIREVLTQAEALGVPRVIPWGPGKWLFRRGRLLRQLLEEFRSPTLFLGDEGGRPAFWGYPGPFLEGARLGVRDLPGTDPLPFPRDVSKVGRMGFRVPIALDERTPGASLLRSLTSQGVTLERFATLESPLRFVRNQIGMQLRKRLRA
jgi:hypothetical protein